MFKQSYYVYVLKYPVGYIDNDSEDLSNVVFYVGKGCKRIEGKERFDDHEIEAKAGTRSTKCQAIRNIWSKGLEAQKAILYETEREEDAVVQERAFIDLYQSSFLTNVRYNTTEINRRKKRVDELKERMRTENRSYEFI